MLFTINEFIDDDIEHRETSWKLCSDIDMNIVIDEVTKSEANKLAWEYPGIIPTGTVWYISTYRHMYDSDDNELAREWTKPQPVINDESNVNDVILPTYSIRDPYIVDISYVYNVGLTFRVLPYEGNVGYDKTIIQLKTGDGTQLVVKEVDISVNPIVTIPTTDIDFSVINYVFINVMHIGLHSTISQLHTTKFHIRDVYYTIEGNKTNIDPKAYNLLTIKTQNDTPVTLLSAVLTLLDGSVVSTCTINDDDKTILIPNTIEYNKSYFIDISLIYADENDRNNTTTDRVHITTKTVSEVIDFDYNHTYEFIVDTVKNYDNTDDNFLVDVNTPMYSEELYTHTIPLRDKGGYISSFIYDSYNKNTALSKSNVIAGIDVGLQLLTEDILLNQYVTDNTLHFKKYSFNPYTNSYTFVSDIDTNSFANDNTLYRAVIINGDIYIVTIDSNDRKIMIVNKLDILTDTITELTRVTLANDIDGISVANFDNKAISIFAKGENITTTYQYNLNSNIISEHITLPDGFTNQTVYLTSLNNGTIFGVLVNGNDSEILYFNILRDSSVNSDTITFSNDGKITNLIRLKSGNLLFISKGSNTTSLLELK